MATYGSNPALALAGAAPYLRLFGTVAGGWLMAKSALAASRLLREGSGDPAFNRAKLGTAQFYAEQVLPLAAALVPAVRGGTTVMGFELEQL